MRKTAHVGLPILLAVFLSCATADAVEWRGKAPISHDVIDDDLRVSGRNLLSNAVHVKAVDRDVSIHADGPAIVSGVDANARLYLSAHSGRVITVNLENDLSFRGAREGGLLVAISGGGVVRFVLRGNRRLSFEADDEHSGAHLYVVMDKNEKPTVLFERGDAGNDSADKDVSVFVGPSSSLGFVARTPAASLGAREEGDVIFDPANTGEGLMLLRVADTGSVVVAGRQVADIVDFRLSDIDHTVTAGQRARLQIKNGKAQENATAGLRVLNANQKVPRLMCDPFCLGDFDGRLQGFVLGASGVLEVADKAYLDYVGLTLNKDPLEDLVQDGFLIEAFKERNPSALYIDGTEEVGVTAAQVRLRGSSAVYFRSGVDNLSDIQEHSREAAYTIGSLAATLGAGNHVLSVEGALDVDGDPQGNSALHILSLHTVPTGGSVLVDSNETVFPRRTFTKDDDGYLLRYNNAAFLVNNRLNLHHVNLVHSDENHRIIDQSVLERPDLRSEPTYVGGESFKLCRSVDRPSINLFNSTVHLHTSAAFTGVDIRVPNYETGNVSALKFYHNGRRLDDGRGRFVVLGTIEGSRAANGNSIVDKDVHLDIVQDSEQTNPRVHRLELQVGANTKAITHEIGDADISNQSSLHTLYLGNASNISIGSNLADAVRGPALSTRPELLVNGDYLSFETRGGLISVPEVGSVTGEGAIFVDKNGSFKLGPNARASVASMVVKSRNGSVSLPGARALFDNRIGITDWAVELGEEEQRVIVPTGDVLSDYTLDWGAVVKNFELFRPYEAHMSSAGKSLPLRDENVRYVPEVRGNVDQLHVVRSRLGDSAHIKINGGRVGHMLLQKGYFTAEAPLGLVALSSDGRVGFGSAVRGGDMVDAPTRLGLNGILLAPDGNGVVDLNEDLVIDDVCPILPTSSFGSNERQVLSFYADRPRNVIVKSNGVLDLSHLTSVRQVVRFSGSARLRLEPGARILLGGGVLEFTDSTALVVSPVLARSKRSGNSCADLDAIRAKLLGRGLLVFDDNSALKVLENSFLGIEGDSTCAPHTDLSIILNDSASLELGNADMPGGALQVGNTKKGDAPVSFSFVLNGSLASLLLDREAFLGFGVGVADKLSKKSGRWAVGSLYGVKQITLDLKKGFVQHNQIVSGDIEGSSLLALGEARYLLKGNTQELRLLGGGNLGLLSADSPIREAAQLHTGLLASRELLSPRLLKEVQNGCTAEQLYQALRVRDLAAMASPRATLARNHVNALTLGYVSNGKVIRQEFTRILGRLGRPVSPEDALSRGAVAVVDLDYDGRVGPNEVIELPGS